MNEFIKKLIERFKEVGNIQFSGHTKPLIAVEDAIQIINQVAEEYGEGWIPFTHRELTEEEKKEANIDFDYILDCRLPDDGQEILVSYKNGHVGTDTFFNDCGECYLDSGDDFVDDVIAWQPLPDPYIPPKKTPLEKEQWGEMKEKNYKYLSTLDCLDLLIEKFPEEYLDKLEEEMRWYEEEAADEEIGECGEKLSRFLCCVYGDGNIHEWLGECQ